MMPIEFRGSYTPRHMLKITGGARRVMGGEPIWSGVLLFGLGALIAMGIAINALIENEIEEALIFGGGAMLAIVFVFIQWRAVKRALESGAGKEMRGTISDDGIHLITPESESRTTWKIPTSFIANNDVLILFHGEANTVTAFPRDFFATETEFQNAVAMARANLKEDRRSSWRRIKATLTWMVVIILVILLWSLFRAAK